MQTRQNFVVEFKSNRRQKKIAGTSIWGDIDLKSLARAVEADLPDGIACAGSSSKSPPPSPSPAPSEVRLQDVIDKPADQLPAAASEMMVSPPEATPQRLAISDEPTGMPLPALSTREAAFTPAEHHAASDTTNPRRTTPVQTGAAVSTQQIGFEDLDALEAENRRLKILWRARLQEENAELREMQARLTTVRLT